MPIVSQSSGRDDRAALFPGALLPLFNDAFVESFDLCEEYVARMALAVFESTGLERACQEDATVDQAVARAQLVPAIARVPTHWLLATLANRGWLRTSSNARGETLYRIEEPLPVLDPGDILRSQETVDPHCLPSY